MTDRRRLWRAENQEISIIQNLFEETYQVDGTREKVYVVDLEKPSCECPDWQKRSPAGGCKHMLKVKLKNGTVEPLRSEKTNTSPTKNRSQSNYSKGWASLSKKTKERDHWECQRCGSRGGQKGDSILHAHHILPKSKGGEDRLDNLITVCHDCHEQIHGHPIPLPDAANLDAPGANCEGATQQFQNSVQSEEIDMHTYQPADTQQESDVEEGYPHSKYDREVPEAESAVQEDQSNETQLQQGQQIETSTDSTESYQGRTGLRQSNSQSENQDIESSKNRTIGIVDAVGVFVGMTVLLTVVFPPTLTFARWKMGTAAGICALIFIIQLISKNGISDVSGLVGFVMYSYLSLIIMTI